MRAAEDEREHMAFLSRFSRSATSARPERIKVERVPDPIYAPVTGDVVRLEEVSDPVFASGVLGRGLGIRPEGGVLYAPATGVVTALAANSLHAVGITTPQGVEILMHVGVDSVEMRGEGFVPYVSKGDRVEAGDALLGFDPQLIARRGHDNVVIVAVRGPHESSVVEPVRSSRVEAGRVAVAVLP